MRYFGAFESCALFLYKLKVVLFFFTNGKHQLHKLSDTHPHTHAHARTHTHTRTHTQNRPSPPPPLPWRYGSATESFTLRKVNAVVNPLHPNISIHILHTVLCTFTKVLTRRIYLYVHETLCSRDERLRNYFQLISPLHGPVIIMLCNHSERSFKIFLRISKKFWLLELILELRICQVRGSLIVTP